jgi:RNA-directed DNA polymerase
MEEQWNIDELEKNLELEFGFKADISGCFDHLSHTALFAQLPVFTETIRRWLKAGTVEFGRVKETLAGAPQGSPLSPLLMNVALDAMGRLFGSEAPDGRRVCASARKGRNRGITLVRYADDVVTVAPSKERIEDYLLPKLKQFLSERGLSLSEAKTRIVCVDERFDFLGFTLYWRRTRRGRWSMWCKTRRARLRRAIQSVAEWCRRHRHLPVAAQHAALTRRLVGHFNYFGVNGNYASLDYLVYRTSRIWFKWLRRRGQRKPLTWARFNHILERFPLPRPRITVRIWG